MTETFEEVVACRQLAEQELFKLRLACQALAHELRISAKLDDDWARTLRGWATRLEQL